MDDPVRPFRPGVLCVIRTPFRDLAAVLLVVAAVLVGRHLHFAYGPARGLAAPVRRLGSPRRPRHPGCSGRRVAVVAYGPRVAARLPWRALLGAAWGAAMAWTWSLALIDGWQRGIAVRLTTRYEYLRVIDRFQNTPRRCGTSPTTSCSTPPAAGPRMWRAIRRGRRSRSSSSTGPGSAAGAGPESGASPSARPRTWRYWSRCERSRTKALARRAAPFLVLTPAAVRGDVRGRLLRRGRRLDRRVPRPRGHRPPAAAHRLRRRAPLRPHLLSLLRTHPLRRHRGRRPAARPAANPAPAPRPRRGHDRPAGLHPRGLQLVGGVRPARRALLPRGWRHPAVRRLGVGQPRPRGPDRGPGDGGGPAVSRRHVPGAPARLTARSPFNTPEAGLRTDDRHGASVRVVSALRWREVPRADLSGTCPDVRLALLVAAAFAALLIADLSGMSRADLAAVRRVAPGRMRVSAPALAHGAGRARSASQSPADERLVTGGDGSDWSRGSSPRRCVSG